MFPTFMPQFTKLRMAEFKDRGLIRFCAWMSDFFNQKLNLAATTEFSWNVDGRTSRKCIAAWPERECMNDPDKVTKLVKTLEYPIRAIGAGMRTRKMDSPITMMVSFLNENKPHWSGYFELLKGFEKAMKEFQKLK